MHFFQRLARVFFSQWRGSSSVFFGSGNVSSSGAVVTADTALSLSAVFAGVRFLAQTIASLPLSVYRANGQRRDIDDANPVHYLLHTRPNSDMTSWAFRFAMEWNRLMYGAACAEIQWTANNRVYALWPIEGYRVMPKYDASERLYYLVDGKTRLGVEDVLYVPMVSEDGVNGKGFLSYAAESIGTGLSAQEMAAKFFGNLGKPGGLLKHPGNPRPEARKEIRESWQEVHGGTANANKTGVLWGGWEYMADTSAAKPDEAQLLETRRFAIEEVARLLNIPPHILRDLTRATFSNISHQQTELVVYTLTPTLTAYEQEFDAKLLTPPKVYTKHNVSALMRGDAQTRAQYYKDLFNIGVYSINDIRELEEQNPIGEQGDIYFVPVNMQPAESAAKIGAEPQQQPPTQQPPEPQPQPIDPAAGTQEPMSTRLRPVLVATLRRLFKVQAVALLRAAKKPAKFLAWVDEFYPDYQRTLNEAIKEIGTVAGFNANESAKRIVESMRAATIEMSGNATASELESSVKQLAKTMNDTWPEQWADSLTGAANGQA